MIRDGFPIPLRVKEAIGNTVRRTHQGPNPWLPPQLYAVGASNSCHWLPFGLAGKAGGAAITVSQETCRHPGTIPGQSGDNAHFDSVHGGCHMNTTAVSSGHASLSLSQRLIAGLLALFLGLTLLVGTGFAGDYRLHNGAHDTRHAMGFPCH